MIHIRSEAIGSVSFDEKTATATANVRLTLGDFKRTLFGQMTFALDGVPVKLHTLETNSYDVASGEGHYRLTFEYALNQHTNPVGVEQAIEL